MDKRERNRTAILNALRKSTTPASSARLAQFLAVAGHNLSERTIRLYLNELDEEGLTEARGKRGRVITEKGLTELHAVQTLERIGYLSAKIDRMTYAMDFDLATRTGQVVVNTSLVNPRQLSACMDDVCKVFAEGYAMGTRLALLAPGEAIGDFVVPPDKVGFCTVCSITLNGVLLKHGIPTLSRFGGLVQLQGRRATRFVEMIDYDGTSIDPLEIFIRSRMTDYLGAIRDGNGLIGASFRETPEDARDLVLRIGDRLSAVGLGAFMEVGLPSQAVLNVPVSPGRIGLAVIGGLNPIAILEEMGHHVRSQALAGLLDFARLSHFGELPQALDQYL